MSKLKKGLTRFVGAVAAMALTFSMFGGTAATTLADDTLAAGEYTVDASLSCYVNAMGGIEFGEKLFSGMQVKVDENGKRTATLNFKDDSSLVIYTVNAHVFVNADKSPVGYYDASGNLVTSVDKITLKKSANTALNPAGESVNYLESMTFELPAVQDTYNLYLYIDSQIMGVQFCDGNGTGASNQPNVATPYKAVLSVDWSSAKSGSTSSQSSTVVYDYTSSGTYEVSIPATININKSTKTADYEVVANNFDLPSGAYVTVTADPTGNLYYDGKNVTFTNTLADGQLKASGDKLAGKITVTGTPKAEGKYTGVTNFTIKYVSRS